ncbi:TIGR03757 family integrating conjugative element protein [Pseudomonas protegens]|uniref:TIGR03757 family integrating conjugative element protein n=1 Tax=Pseudomonas protegens TaxID=380021 RepID=A0A2T6GD30_9PSED|nr:TIGR03757 family integrating conjugative element protein [Pseudomonas protegens]PUA42064.1 TIGR03757 family integrating conjugative element protein [Pseudomonas protegens]
MPTLNRLRFSASPSVRCAWLASLALTALFQSHPVLAETEDIWIVTDHAHPVKAPADVRMILLDEQQRLEEQLSRLLPADPAQAAVFAQRYLASPEGLRFQQNLRKARQDVTDAWSLGLLKLPAVVLDRHHVVYGQPDVAIALERIAQFRRNSP